MTNYIQDKTYRTLIEEMHEGAVTLNEEGNILYSNSHFLIMVNLPLQKIIGTKFTNFIDYSSKKVFNGLFKKGWQGNSQSEVYIHNDKGKAVPVMMSVNKLFIEEKQALSIIITDLTIQKKNEEELRGKARELEEKNNELENANKALAIQNKEKEKRAHELRLVNKELAFQNNEKEKRAAELRLANKELTFQNDEKEKRAAELIIANHELAFQNDEKEKRAAELIIANQDLTSFTYISSHDLQEPLRKIQNFVACILLEEEQNLSDSGKDYFLRMSKTAHRMQDLIEDLLAYSRFKLGEHAFVKTDLNLLFKEVISDFDDVVAAKDAIMEIKLRIAHINVIPFQFRQLLQNLINNAFKFSKQGTPTRITITSESCKGSETGLEKLNPDKTYCHIALTDNGIGFDPQYKERIFEVFQRLHSYEEYHGTGIGLAICKRIVENHSGFITATGIPDEGAQFNIYILSEDYSIHSIET